jgi:septal ring-binding cell division protein DamX
MAPEQDWCLECGKAVSTRVAPPPRWGVPLAVGLGALALVGAVVAVALTLLSDDANRAASNGAQRAAATTSARTATTSPAATATPTTSTTTTAATPTTPTTSTPARTTTTPVSTNPVSTNPASTNPASTNPAASTPATGGRSVPVWPRNLQAYTIVVDSTSDRAKAERSARQLIAAGLSAGLLRSDGYDFFSPGAWIVWSGRYPDRPAAEKAAPKVQRKAPSAYVTLIRRRQG